MALPLHLVAAVKAGGNTREEGRQRKLPMRVREKKGELKGVGEEQRATSKRNGGRCATSNGKMRTKYPTAMLVQDYSPRGPSNHSHPHRNRLPTPPTPFLYHRAHNHHIYEGVVEDVVAIVVDYDVIIVEVVAVLVDVIIVFVVVDSLI